jgi:hypothetical protein
MSDRICVICGIDCDEEEIASSLHGDDVFCGDCHKKHFKTLRGKSVLIDRELLSELLHGYREARNKLLGGTVEDAKEAVRIKRAVRKVLKDQEYDY